MTAGGDMITLPKLYYENSQKLVDEILRIAKKWISPPFNVDGWRLDVAADLGYTKEFNHKFWAMFRDAVKSVNKDTIISPSITEIRAFGWTVSAGTE